MSEYVVTDGVSKILKNFAEISDSALLREGTTQKTVNTSKSIMAIAELASPWPQETAVYQLHELLSNLSAYDKPTLTFTEKQFIIKGSNSPSHVEYPYSDPSVIVAPPDRELPLTDPEAVFTLPQTAVTEIKKLAAINNLPTISIEINPSANTITIKPHDDKNPNSRSYSYPVHADPKLITSLTAEKSLVVRFRCDLFALLMDGAYTVTVGTWPYVHFAHQTESVSYYIVRNPDKK